MLKKQTNLRYMRYAVIVGINDYENARRLKYCAKDAENIADTFVNFCNVESENIRLITSSIIRPQANPWATFKDIINSLKTDFNPNVDDLLFYFSGHGIEAEQTTVIFKNQDKTVYEIIQEIDALSPKTKILIFDSCHSGSGYSEAEKSAQFFSFSSQSTSGYYILSACTKEQTAKESDILENGKFTRFFIDTISNKQNYNQDSYLDINSLFSKVDIFFKSHPEFEQSPFQQIKSVGSYPIANSFNDEHCYLRFDVKEPENFDWTEMINGLNTYLKTKESVIGEFSRVIREQFDNTSDPLKGNAKLQSIEITKNKVCLIDNGNYFDFFEKSNEVKSGGGTETAESFKQEFGDLYSYSTKSENGVNTYEFVFKELELTEICRINVNWDEIYKFNQNKLVIDDQCEHFTIRFEKFVMMRSMIRISIEHLIEESKRTGKTIYMEFHEGDNLLTSIEKSISYYDASTFIKIKTYKE
jgi:hypothetical protein